MARRKNNEKLIYDLWKAGGLGLSTTKAMNWQTELIYVDHLLNLLTTEFTWDDSGVPEELRHKQYYIESTLNMFGCMVLFKEPITGKFLFLQATPNGAINPYREYESFTAMGANGLTFQVKREDCVVFWNTINRSLTTGLSVTSTAYRMAEVIRTADVRLLNHKTPVIFACTEEQKKTVDAYMRGLNNNEQCIVLYDRQMEIPQPVNNDVQFLQDKLLDYQNDILEQFLMLQGFNVNPNNDKKERQIIAEVDSNNEFIRTNRNIKLLPRIDANEECMEKFGFKFNVKYSYEKEEEVNINDDDNSGYIEGEDS